VVTVGETVVEPDVPGALKPLPVQLVAFVLLQVSVEDCPLVIEVGFAESVAVGCGLFAVTVTVAVAGDEVPPAPVQVTEYVVVVVGETVAVPDVPLAVKLVPVQLGVYQIGWALRCVPILPRRGKGSCAYFWSVSIRSVCDLL